MLFRTHFIFALFFFLGLYRFFDNIFLFGLFLLFATFFVDIDIKRSKMGKILFFRPFQILFRHRGFCHSIIFALLISSLIFVINFSAGFGFLIGYILHLFLDCFTLSGVNLFWPFSNYKFKGFIKTGGILEEVLFVIFLLIDIFLILRFVWNMILSSI